MVGVAVGGFHNGFFPSDTRELFCWNESLIPSLKLSPVDAKRANVAVKTTNSPHAAYKRTLHRLETVNWSDWLSFSITLEGQRSTEFDE